MIFNSVIILCVSILGRIHDLQVLELIYYLYFFFVFGAKAIGLNEGQMLFNSCILLGVVLFAVKIMTTRATVLEYLLSTGIFLSGILTYYFSGEKGLLICFSMMLGMKAISSKRIVKLGFCILAPAFLILYLLSIAGFIQGLDHMYKKSGYGFLLRRSLGYPYPNTTHTTFLILLILFFCLYNAKNIKKLLMAVAVSMLLSLYLYLYTMSLTGVLSVAIFLVVTIYFYTRTKRSRIENILIELLFPVTVVFSIVGPLLAKGEVFDFMNKLLHKRYEYALYYLQTEKVTLFGSRFAEAPTNWYMIDNSFLYLFLQLGVIPFAIICILYIGYIHYLIKNNRTKELAIVVTFAFIGMSDPFLFNLSCKNISFIFMGAWFYSITPELSKKLPQVFGKEFILLPIGEKMIYFPDFSKNPIVLFIKKTGAEFLEHAIRYILIFALIGLGTSALYNICVPVSDYMYVDTDIVDPYFSHKSTEMTTEDVEAAISVGDLVIGYDSEDPTMYVFKGKAPLMEHYRGTISSGVLMGLAVSTLAVIAASGRKKRS